MSGSSYSCSNTVSASMASAGWTALMATATGGCFCGSCEAKARAVGLDWESILRECQHLAMVSSGRDGAGQHNRSRVLVLQVFLACCGAAPAIARPVSPTQYRQPGGNSTGERHQRRARGSRRHRRAAPACPAEPWRPRERGRQLVRRRGRGIRCRARDQSAHDGSGRGAVPLRRRRRGPRVAQPLAPRSGAGLPACGKAVISEIPYALDLAGATELVEVAEQTGLQATVAHSFRFAAP